jgi:hypothetical protein
MELGKVEVKLYVYDGTSGGFADTDLKYTISKERITSHTGITIEIAELVRDYLTVSFNNDYPVNTRWASAVVTYYNQAGVEFPYNSPQTFNYIALDGYGIFEDGVNPQLSDNALISANNIYLPENTTGKFPIFREGVGKVIIDSTTTEITDSGNSNQKIQYITIPVNSSTFKVYDTDDHTLLKTVTIHNICEPKYTPYKVTFVNKFGAFQDVYFFKKTVEKFDITDENYNRNIISNSSYNTYDNERQRYNLKSKTSLILNTGFILEDANVTIEELFLSENVWIRYNSKTLPIIPKSKNFEYKTSLNDKLINYTVDFEFAFDKINNVR